MLLQRGGSGVVHGIVDVDDSSGLPCSGSGVRKEVDVTIVTIKNLTTLVKRTNKSTLPD